MRPIGHCCSPSFIQRCLSSTRLFPLPPLVLLLRLLPSPVTMKTITTELTIPKTTKVFRSTMSYRSAPFLRGHYLPCQPYHRWSLLPCKYWLPVYDVLHDGGTTGTTNVLRHEVIFVLVWMDGLVVNRIPVRLRHWVEICLPAFLAYLIWTILQSPLVFEMENPYEEDDDQIYG